MSKFRDKAAEIKAEGAEKRGEFNPKGAPLRIYNYWLSETRSQKGRDIRNGRRKENFCHFWRVVAIWAPLMFGFRALEDLVDSRWFPPVAFGTVAIGFIAFLLTTEGFGGLLVLLGILAVVAAIVGVGVGVAVWAEKFPNAARKVGKVLGYGVLAAGVLFVLGLIVFAGGLTGIILLTIGLVLGFVIYTQMENIADYIEGMRERAERKRKARLAEYRRQANEYYNEHGYYPSEAPAKEPGMVSKFFTGVGDFIIMIAQVIRVKKWGICPIVEIEREKIDYDSGWETA